MQKDFYEMMMLMVGEDLLWWMIPTHPELHTNYFERVWSKKEMKKMAQEEKFDRKEDDSDPDKKMFSVEVRKARFEKKMFALVVAGSIFMWFSYI
jgi:hypothetical protein